MLRFNGDTFGQAGKSHESHRETMSLANYKGSALTTGCSTGGSCGVRTELMDMKDLSWHNEDDFPYTQLVFLYFIHFK